MSYEYLAGASAVIDDEVSVQRGEHVGKAGIVRERLGARLLVVPWPRSSWTAFWINDADVAVVRATDGTT
jgi:hypothetical protein